MTETTQPTCECVTTCGDCRKLGDKCGGYKVDPKAHPDDATFADRTQRAAAPQAVQPAVPVGGQSRFKGEQDWGWCSIAHVAMVLATPLEWQNYEVRYVYAHPAEGVPAQAVASIYITENGERELDNWKVPLSVGRNLLYTQPAAHGLDAKDCDMFWVADEPDQNHDTLHDAVVRAYEDGGLQTDSTVEIQCAKCIGNVVARITSTDPLAFELLIDAELTAQADQGTEMKVSVE